MALAQSHCLLYVKLVCVVLTNSRHVGYDFDVLWLNFSQRMNNEYKTLDNLSVQITWINVHRPTVYKSQCCLDTATLYCTVVITCPLVAQNYSHSHGNFMGFPFPCASLLRSDLSIRLRLPTMSAFRTNACDDGAETKSWEIHVRTE